MERNSVLKKYWVDRDSRRVLREMFDAAVSSVDPLNIVPEFLPEPPRGRCIVVGAGKAAAPMAAAVDAAWRDVDVSGMVVTPYGYGMPSGRIDVREAAHPIPDANSLFAANEVVELLSGLDADDLVLCLISGGGSSVMALPAAGITFDEKRATTALLLRSGLDIRTINAVRRRMSAIKGGGLLRMAAPAQVLTLCISDIPGDDITAIASGPSLPADDDSINFTRVADMLGAELPAAVRRRLLDGAPAPAIDTPFVARMIGSSANALEAAAKVALRHGLDPVILGDDIEGESRQVGQAMALRALEQIDRPTVLLSGGETTVTLSGAASGRGGRNTEFLLSTAIALNERPGIWGLAADTDGMDGSSAAAGAIFGPETLARAKAMGVDPVDYLAGHDSASFFKALDDLVLTGPTRTNVNDFRAILIDPQGNC